MSTEPQRPRRPGRPPKSEAQDTKGALIEAALDLFARHGYGGTSVRAIAQATGLSESVLYRHFANKQAIFEEVLFQAGVGLFESQRAQVDPALAAHDPAAFLRALARNLVTAWTEPRNRLLTSVLVRAIGDSHLQVISTFKTAQEEMSHLIAHWIGAGLIPPDRGRPDQLAWELFAPAAFVRLLYLHAEADPDTQRAGHELVLAHAEFFIARVLPTSAKPTAVSTDSGDDHD
ncbi:DNA-binding transcriptional regulator, AcrR family [Nonomuraea solani]|uniref:DNA-binding transcriptional regulator, AcrR family n=1 Tax=Nonomuraea solani TaxID=1144553 RepID=A0A1H5YC05_9ACTN|nr:TetR/AcrR family transcriptional regulator [Nonomuraea solani]SEG21504.1 DNA-binding transcriptional regulator, AcrR family [Nonomuraea solani]